MMALTVFVSSLFRWAKLGGYYGGFRGVMGEGATHV